MSFYCINICEGGIDYRINGEFSIDEWNEVEKHLRKLNIPEPDQVKVLFPEQCKEQCDCCINVVLDTQEKRRLKMSSRGTHSISN